MTQILIKNDTVVIDKLAVAVNGDLSVTGTSSVTKLEADAITAEVIRVKYLITTNPLPVIEWCADTEATIVGTGITWKCDSTVTTLSYQPTGQLSLNNSLNLSASSTYLINNMPVISVNRLGASVTKSNLQQVGNLISLSVVGKSTLHDITATNITADTLHVRQLIVDTDTPVSADSITTANHWMANSEDELNSQGLIWEYNSIRTLLMYRTGQRVWTNGNFDIPLDSSYMIDNIPVLTSNTIGSSITKSNLKQVGALRSLQVVGDASLGGFTFINTATNRVGIGTDTPSAALSIAENNIEISLGSPAPGIASIGTRTNHNLSIISDNIPRIIVKNNGEIHVSDEFSKAGILRVFGSIYADTIISENIVSDTRVERSSSLEFVATSGNSIYGKGLMWQGTGIARQFIMASGPDRLWSSESIDTSGSYMINKVSVLSSTRLESPILHSNLITVGTLTSLKVAGDALLSTVTANTVAITGDNAATLTNDGLITANNASIIVDAMPILQGDATEIVIGNIQQKQLVKVCGAMSIGINNPDPTLSLSVSGNVSFNNKKFITGISSPLSGIFLRGDICWNQLPTEHGYVGWICIQDGSPGEWRPFGALGT
jgi:hypothetical protein